MSSGTPHPGPAAPGDEPGIADATEFALTPTPSNLVPPGGRAFALRTGDGIRLRSAVWNPAGARGTVVVYPGRTEPIELHFQTVRFILDRGWAAAAVDWRSQGRSTRPLSDRNKCHVVDFDEYQTDAAAFLESDPVTALPRPRVLLGHSMGAAIALRQLATDPALAEGLVLCAPLLELRLGWFGNLLTRNCARLVCWTGGGTRYAVLRGARPTSAAGYPGNPLTSSRDWFAVLREIEGTIPGLAVGGPSWAWLRACYRECQRLRRLPPPPVPGLLTISTKDRVVSPSAVLRLVRRWPRARLFLSREGRHSLLIETEDVRAPLLAAVGAFLETVSSDKTPH